MLEILGINNDDEENINLVPFYERSNNINRLLDEFIRLREELRDLATADESESSEEKIKPKAKKRGRPKARSLTRSQNKRNENEFQSDPEISNKIFQLGSLWYDVPKKILDFQLKKGKIYCRVEWNKRYDGSYALNSLVESSRIAVIYPKLLIKFYETKLKF